MYHCCGLYTLTDSFYWVVVMCQVNMIYCRLFLLCAVREMGVTACLLGVYLYAVVCVMLSWYKHN